MLTRRRASRFVSFAWLPLLVTAATAQSPATSQPVSLPGASQHVLRASSGRDYVVMIAAPAGPAPAAGHPVLYVTDGNTQFFAAMAAVRGRPRGVVVGIGYPDVDPTAHVARRYHDLTSPANAEWLAASVRPPLPEQVGGNEAFFRFLEGEVKPFVAKQHAIDASRQTLFGHSLGGLFTLHVLFTHPEAFQNYVASSPSLWWNDGAIASDETAFTNALAERSARATVLITVGGDEQTAPPSAPPERAALLAKRRMVDGSRELADRLGKLAPHGLAASHVMFAGEDHGSAALPAIGRATRLAFGALTPPN